jgi:hypothetical protein
VAGIGAAGAGGWLLYDGIVNGWAKIAAARADHEAATSADAQVTWEAWNAALTNARTRVYLGIGLASGGVLFTDLGADLGFTSGTGAGEPAVSIRVTPAPMGADLSLAIRY